MSNPDTDNIQIETPDETPLFDGVPEDQEFDDGTPGDEPTPEADDDGAVEDGKHEKTPEQIEADKAFWQKKYQEKVAAADKAHAELDRAMRKSGDGDPETLWERPSFTPAKTPDPVQPQQPQQQPQGLEDLQERLQTEPLLQMQLMGAYVQDVVKNTISEERKLAEAKADFEAEDREARRVLRQFRDDNKVTDEVYKEAYESLKSLGIKGRPGAIAKLLIDRMNYGMMANGVRERTIKAEAEVAEKVKTQKLTVQPSAGGLAPKSKKSAGEELADAIAPRTVS